jgi:hypothetical protein
MAGSQDMPELLLCIVSYRLPGVGQLQLVIGTWDGSRHDKQCSLPLIFKLSSLQNNLSRKAAQQDHVPRNQE